MTGKWTIKKEKAAWLVADARLTVEEISSELKVCEATLYNWKKEPIFQDKVEEHLTFISRITQMNHARIEALVTRRAVNLLQRPGVGIRELTELLKLYLPHKVQGEVQHSLGQSSDQELDSIIKSFQAGYDTGQKESSRSDSGKVKKTSD